MHSSRSFSLRLVLSVMVATVAGACSSSPEPRPNCPTPPPLPATDLTTPQVSFKTDIHPEFLRSCGLFVCHGSRQGYNQGIYLGQDLALTYAAMVNVPADQLREMNYVTPGDPAKSYLMVKLDGLQCTMHDRCVDGNCGEPMPNGLSQLPLTKRDTIRRWIAQGAPNN